MFARAAALGAQQPCGKQPQLCSKSSSFLALQHSRSPCLRLCSAAARPRGARLVSVRASAAPLLRGAARLAVRTLPANFLAGVFAAARSGRFAPVIIVALAAYSVGVTLYATNTRRQVAAAAAAAPAAPPAPSSSSSLSSIELLSVSEEEAAPESLAEALAAAAVAPSAERPKEKEHKSEVCKVCGGTGQVSYENHMQSYDGTVCPCCLGKGRVKKNRANLISALLSFDP